jgi:hypothetical protein
MDSGAPPRRVTSYYANLLWPASDVMDVMISYLHRNDCAAINAPHARFQSRAESDAAV